MNWGLTSVLGYLNNILPRLRATAIVLVVLRNNTTLSTMLTFYNKQTHLLSSKHLSHLHMETLHWSQHKWNPVHHYDLVHRQGGQSWLLTSKGEPLGRDIGWMILQLNSVVLGHCWPSIFIVGQESAGESFYMLFRAIKHQVDKGPVDAVTGKAKYTLNDNRLLREDVEYRTLVSTHTDTVHSMWTHAVDNIRVMIIQ